MRNKKIGFWFVSENKKEQISSFAGWFFLFICYEGDGGKWSKQVSGKRVASLKLNPSFKNGPW